MFQKNGAKLTEVPHVRGPRTGRLFSSRHHGRHPRRALRGPKRFRPLSKVKRGFILDQGHVSRGAEPTAMDGERVERILTINSGSSSVKFSSSAWEGPSKEN